MSAGSRSAYRIASVISVRRQVGAGAGLLDAGVAVHVAPGARRRQDGAGLLLGTAVLTVLGGGAVPDPLRDLHRRDRRRVAAGGPGPCRALGTPPQRLEDPGDLRLVERLLVEELEDQGVQDVAVLLQDLERLLVGGREQPLGLLVDDRRDLLGVVPRVAQVAAQERLGVGVA